MHALPGLGRCLAMPVILSGALFGRIAGVGDNRHDNREAQSNPGRIYSSA